MSAFPCGADRQSLSTKRGTTYELYNNLKTKAIIRRYAKSSNSIAGYVAFEPTLQIQLYRCSSGLILETNRFRTTPDLSHRFWLRGAASSRLLKQRSGSPYVTNRYPVACRAAHLGDSSRSKKGCTETTHPLPPVSGCKDQQDPSSHSDPLNRCRRSCLPTL